MSRRASAHGGARAGAGRPATGRTVLPLQLHLPPDVIAIIDSARGEQSRSKWVAMAVRLAAAVSS